MSITIQPKPYPFGYSQNIVDMINIITFSKGNPNYFHIQGSSGISSQIYYGDYDLYEIVKDDLFGENITKEEYVEKIAKNFQNMIRKLLSLNLVYIGDIKCGEIPEWNITSYEELKKLYDTKIINNDEFKLASRELKCITCKSSRRFGVIRWKPDEILKGYKILRDGRKYTLQDGITSNIGLTKIDIISYIHNKFVEISILYNFKYHNRSLNIMNIGDLYESTMLSYLEKKFFKVLKRMFSIARLEYNKKQLLFLNDILNSDLGRLYSVISDINTILYILDNYKSIPKVRLENEIQEFRARLANIYKLEEWMKVENYVLKKISKLRTITSNKKLYNELDQLKDILNLILNYYSLEFMIDNKLCVYKCDTDERIDETNHIFEMGNILKQLNLLKNNL